MKLTVSKAFQKDIQKVDKHILLAIKDLVIFLDNNNRQEIKLKYRPVKLQ